MSARLSVVVLTHNEAGNLEACLASAAWADEVIVCDSGSTDATLEIARRHGARIVEHRDWQGFGVQRQRAQAACTGDWVLMLDADERITPELRASIARVLASDDRSRAYEVARLSWCFGRYIRHSGWYPDRVLRLYPRERGGYNAALVHEKVELAPGIKVGCIAGDLLHFTYRDLQHYLVKSAGYAAAWAVQRALAGRRSSLAQGLWHGLACFLKMYLFRAGFLDGRAGFLLAVLSAHSTFAKYADLWVRAQPGRPK